MLAPDLPRLYRLISCIFFSRINVISLVLCAHIYNTFAYPYARDGMKNKVSSFICIAKASFTWSPSFIACKISFTRHVVRIVKSLFIRNEYSRLIAMVLATGRRGRRFFMTERRLSRHRTAIVNCDSNHRVDSTAHLPLSIG